MSQHFQKCQNFYNLVTTCIQISTNMPIIDLVIREIDFEKPNSFLHGKTNVRVLNESSY